MIDLPKRHNYSTHLPVIKSICDIFKPKGVLELGCGFHSTPFLKKYNGMVVSVENDKKWCDRVKEVCCDSGFFKLIHHDLGEGVNKMTSYKHISDKQFNSARLFYDKILSEYDLDFLFVDHWRSLRAKTVQYLHSKFKYVVYHDAYDRRKEYNFRDLRISNDYDRFLYKSFVASTGIIIKKPYEKKEDFKEALKKQGREFLYNMYPNKKYKHKLEEIK